jgi:ribonuclease J
MVRDLESAECLTGAAVICSVWSGYIDDPRQWFVEWMKGRGIRLDHCPTSGHASMPDMRRLRDAFPPAVAVPVHLTDRERFSTLFSNVQLRGDGEWWKVAKESEWQAAS